MAIVANTERAPLAFETRLLDGEDKTVALELGSPDEFLGHAGKQKDVRRMNVGTKVFGGIATGMMALAACTGAAGSWNATGSWNARQLALKDVVDRLWTVVDDDANGKIMKDEVEEARRTIGVRVGAELLGKQQDLPDEELFNMFDDEAWLVDGWLRPILDAMFVEADTDGELGLTKDEFKNFIGKVSVRMAFKVFDKDGDGNIERTEFHDSVVGHVADLVEAKLSDDELKQAWNQAWDEADTDGEDGLNYAEFRNFIDKVSALVVFKVFDKDNNKSIDREEFRDVLKELKSDVTEEQIVALFNKADESGDDEISVKEFETISKEIIKMVFGITITA